MLMKILTFLTLLLSILSFTGCSSEPEPFNVEDLKVLGTSTFSKNAWAEAEREERGAMLYDLLKTHNLIGQPVEVENELLGEQTSYYIHDSFPAYQVGPTNVHSVHGIGYIMAFITDPQTGRVVKYDVVPKLSKKAVSLSSL